MRWWQWMVETMTGVGRRRKSAFVGGDGSSEEKPCPVPVHSPRSPSSTEITELPSRPPEITHVPLVRETEIDYYTQAIKALSQRCPFDSAEAEAVLPGSLSQRHFGDSRKKSKKPHSGGETKKSSSAQPRGPDIWLQTEEYFRELTVEDIEKLQQTSTLGFGRHDKCLSIPSLSPSLSLLGNGSENDGGTTEQIAAMKEESEQEELMDIDDNSMGAKDSYKEDKGENSCSSSFSSLEWLLGSRSKVYLASERPSKKRKLMGGDAGLEKLLVAHPVDGASMCHYCSLGDLGDQLNRLIVCTSCGMMVHQRCYGVQDDADTSWLCSWCKQKSKTQSTDRPCLLCPKQGGALKRACKRELSINETSDIEFAHLFCCQWMPEVYVENTRAMEPIVNIDGIKETRKKLICYLCKVKWGACVRCSNGACRTSFHPTCAREANHRMEIWGKLGCDDVELRAFCSKHSEVQIGDSSLHNGDMSVKVGFDLKTANSQPVPSSLNKLELGQVTGDKITAHVETADLDSYKLNGENMNKDVLDNSSTIECQSDGGNVLLPAHMDALDKNILTDDKCLPDPGNLFMLLKKLLDHGKIDLEDAASQMGVSPESLTSMLSDNHLAPDLHFRIVKWLRSYAYTGNLQKPLKVKIKSAAASTAETDAVNVANSNTHGDVPVKSVPPRRRTKSNIRIMKEDLNMCLSKEILHNDPAIVDEVKNDCFNVEDLEENKGPPIEVTKKNLTESPRCQEMSSDKVSGEDPSKPLGHGCIDDQAQELSMPLHHSLVDCITGDPIHSTVSNQQPDSIMQESMCSSHIHPLIQYKLIQVENEMLKGHPFHESGSGERESSQLEASSSSGICCTGSPIALSLPGKFKESNLEQLVKARRMGLIELSPNDELEGELLFYQQKLLCNAIARKHLSDDLISKVARSLPQEIDVAKKQKWDSVMVSQYLYELREAKKQGRREKRHKEAQAVLAAATAAAASSSRASSLRKDTLEESVQEEQNLRKKEMLLRNVGQGQLAETMVSPFQFNSDFSKEHPRSCDICMRPETILNPILVCSNCKVSVHLDCYRSSKDSAGPWCCELCEDLLSSGRAQASNSWDVAECGLCGGTAGAFRKSTNGQWIHAFCAEWVLVSTFRRGQPNPVDGLESISKGRDACVICHRKQGVCIKCNQGNCQSTFHPPCARSAGFYMNVRTINGKLQHKAYCGKHSLEQRVKAETHKHGIDELKSLKQVRVELERLRLLCERIIKREKLKRELVLCSHDILASNRDATVLSALTRRPFFHHDASSESATTTSIKGYTDDCRSGSEIMQRSDDVTVDSTVAGKRRVKFPMAMEIDQKTDDSSTSQNVMIQTASERVSFSGKKIPNRSSITSRTTSDDGKRQSRQHIKHSGTFGKEMVMTSDQASMKNQRLPKGYVYVPVQCFSKETSADACSGEPPEQDGT